MENKSPLFRQDVINNRMHRNLGCARINIPLNYRVASYVALGIVFASIGFFYIAQISERMFIKGYLDTENGIISVDADFSGLVKQVLVEEGSVVKKDQLLLVI